MSTISKSKIRSLPYDMRLNLISKQKDFFTEAKIFINDYPDRCHSRLEDLIINEFKNSNMKFIDMIANTGLDCSKLVREMTNILYDDEIYNNFVLARMSKSLSIRTNDNGVEESVDHLIQFIINSFKRGESEKNYYPTVSRICSDINYILNDHKKNKDVKLLRFIANDMIPFASYKEVLDLLKHINKIDKDNVELDDMLNIHDIIT